MKRKYFIMVISIIVVMAIGIISLPFIRKAKSEHEYSVMVANRNKAFEEMIAFCEENQNEMEAYSSRYLAMKHPDMSWKELGKLEDQVAEELDCKWMFEEISVGYPEGMGNEKEIVLYCYKDFDHHGYDGVDIASSVEIYYIEEEISQQEFEEFFGAPYYLDDVRKINNHLYVCVTGYMCL